MHFYLYYSLVQNLEIRKQKVQICTKGLKASHNEKLTSVYNET